MIPPLIIRADAGPFVGIGHVVRSLALAHAWQDRGGSVVFVTTSPSAIPGSIPMDGIEVIPMRAAHPASDDAETIERLVAGYSGAWVVCDGYHFDAGYTSRVHRAGARILVIDDHAHAPLYSADVLLNQNLGADRLEYHFDRQPTLLLGPRFALLRRVFQPWRGQSRDIPDRGSSLLVSVGGGEATRVAVTIIRACRRLALSPLRVIVLVGPESQGGDAIASAARSSRGIRFETTHNPADIATLMAGADFAVSASGSTVWELCFMGVPAALVTIADNQAGVAEHLQEYGCAISLGWHADLNEQDLANTLERFLLDKAARASMSERGRTLVDGLGATRVAETLQDLWDHETN